MRAASAGRISVGPTLDAPASYPHEGDLDEVIPFAARPGLHARRLCLRQFARVVDVMRGALHEHAPAGTSGLVELVDLKGDPVLATWNLGAQVRNGQAVLPGTEQDRAVHQLVVDRQDGQVITARVRDPADPAARDQAQALGLIENLK